MLFSDLFKPFPCNGPENKHLHQKEKSSDNCGNCFYSTEIFIILTCKIMNAALTTFVSLHICIDSGKANQYHYLLKIFPLLIPKGL